MTLLEILVRELPKRGGWPDDARLASKSPDGHVSFVGNAVSPFIKISPSETGYQWERVTRKQYEAALAAVEPEWNGEGLPPVGCLVELMDDSQSATWGEARIKFWGESFVVWDDYGEECSNSLCHVKVRPIHSEADRKRDEITKRITDIYRNTPGYCDDGFRAVYDAIEAGKIPHLKIV